MDMPASPSSVTVSGTALSLLATFLIQRACQSPTVANFFYWYLKVETEDENTGVMFQNIFDTFIINLSIHSDHCKIIATQLRALDDYMKQIARCQGLAREEKGRKAEKQDKLKILLRDEVKEIPGGVTKVPMPLDPTIQMCGIDAMKTFMFASAIYPCTIALV